MTFEEVKRPFTAPGWTFELKHDGYRTLALVGPDGVRLRSRNGSDASGWFAEVARGLRAVQGGAHVLDGEVVVQDELGRSNFDLLQDRARRRGYKDGDPLVIYAAFDLLFHDGVDIRHLPLVERKARLKELLSPAPDSVMYVQDLPELGLELYQAALQLELEGIVAKRLDSPYESGVRTRHWLKIKRPGAVPAKRFRHSSA